MLLVILQLALIGVIQAGRRDQKDLLLRHLLAWSPTALWISQSGGAKHVGGIWNLSLVERSVHLLCLLLIKLDEFLINLASRWDCLQFYMLIAANFYGLWLLLRTQIELDVGVCKTAAAPRLLGEAPTHCLVHCLIYLLFLFLSILFLNHSAVLSVVFSLPF